MPRYFFPIGLPGSGDWRSAGSDCAGDETAIEAARKVIDELLAERGPEDSNPTIIVKNEADEIIYRYPSN
jgi:Domain of unknown function (DUF6894)